jgi:mRNA-degrading endonuclease toxin of MazEF toxin-antitoxin module
MKRGEVRWYTFRAPDKRRPVLILTRDVVADALERTHRGANHENRSWTCDGGHSD